ncbi:ExeM/NucH family extracellular endonuclease [Aeromonas veronii]|uniref:Gammaproteobacterial enzyme C-terminal transmembrane domain-containing protein n=1 Tax=Aeromonas veronii AMC34 TaxID=1073383 RepID=K1INP1_AERVE|nr:ExeM/NucH family extracellular endonuclease [Aeromonas veronii]EKB20665.1 gammaproteobacterial enzyme C-terminal transmembrane domain-containing protein [Aeromonas veronii AMC34]MCF5762732.1 ExeM/NucH family extracellular endonuclease [Aeromonas veronii]
MKGTRTLLSLAVGLALAAPGAHAAFVCPTDPAQLTPIPTIQGTGSGSQFATDTVTDKNGNVTGKISPGTFNVRGIVTALGQSLTKGFYLTDPVGDGNPETSDGIFVYLNDKEFATSYADIKPGAELCLEAKVEEYYGGTQLKPTFESNKARLQVTAQGLNVPTSILQVNEGETLVQALNRHEGMRVRLNSSSDLHLTRNYGFDYKVYRNNVELSHKAPLLKPTQIHVASSPEAVALAAKNGSNRLVVESDYKAPDGVLPWFSGWDADQGYLRIGDQLTGLEGVIVYNKDAFRLVVPSDVTLTAGALLRSPEEDRQDAPARLSGSDLRIGSFNVLNYFTSHSSIGGALNILCKNQADADSTKGCNRGAKSQPEFEKQRTKIVNAITAMDADLLGLMEMENNGFEDNSALHNLVTRLNEQQKDASKHYAYVRLPVTALTDGKFFGGDAIMVAMIYRPALLTPSGDASVIKLPEQRYITGGVAKTAGQRDSLVQTFTLAKSKEPLTLVVNHLKSKGSGCYENGDGKTEPADLQGKCTEFRVSAAKVLGEAVSKLPGQVLLVGDFNSYAKEDPIRVLTDYNPATSERKILSASHTFIGDQSYEQLGREVTRSYGLIDLNVKFNKEKAISYSYDGELGTLDYALANPALASKVAGVADWHINSFESNLFEYGSQYTGTLLKSDNPFSASDHDPIIVDLRLESDATKPDTSSGGGALGLGLLALLPLAWRRRR